MMSVSGSNESHRRATVRSNVDNEKERKPLLCSCCCSSNSSCCKAVRLGETDVSENDEDDEDEDENGEADSLVLC